MRNIWVHSAAWPFVPLMLLTLSAGCSDGRREPEPSVVPAAAPREAVRIECPSFQALSASERLLAWHLGEVVRAEEQNRLTELENAIAIAPQSARAALLAARDLLENRHSDSWEPFLRRLRLDSSRVLLILSVLPDSLSPAGGRIWAGVALRRAVSVKLSDGWEALELLAADHPWPNAVTLGNEGTECGFIFTNLARAWCFRAGLSADSVLALDVAEIRRALPASLDLSAGFIPPKLIARRNRMGGITAVELEQQ